MEPDFTALQLQLANLWRLKAELPERETREMSAAEAASLAGTNPLLSPHVAVSFVAREVGAAIMSVGGWKALDRAINRLECESGPDAAEWFSRRCAGLTDSTGAVWSD